MFDLSTVLVPLFNIGTSLHDYLLTVMIFTYPFATVERLTWIRQQRAEAAKKREEEKAGIYIYIYLLLLLTTSLAFPSNVLETCKIESLKLVELNCLLMLYHTLRADVYFTVDSQRREEGKGTQVTCQTMDQTERCAGAMIAERWLPVTLMSLELPFTVFIYRSSSIVPDGC